MDHAKLEKLHELKEAGHLSEEEFQVQKQRLLNEANVGAPREALNNE